MIRYADRSEWYRSAILEHVEIAKDTYRLRFSCPGIAQSALPGQFVMLRIAGALDPLIGRAFAVFDRYRDETGRYRDGNGEWEGIDLLYVRKGRMTQRLCTLKVGQDVEAWGPLGNSFSTDPVDHLILVAGGVGETPMLCAGLEALGKASFGSSETSVSRKSGYAKRVTLCYGARTSSLLACVDQFESAGFDVRISTDDGSQGKKQKVTESLIQALDEVGGTCRIACCGPEPMMAAVAEIAKRRGIPCQVSLETPMACGIGICFTCVAKVAEGPGQDWDYKRTCVEGPIFDASQIIWE